MRAHPPLDWTAIPDASVANSYAELILRRAADGMPASDYATDWSRVPFSQKHYLDSPLIALGGPFDDRNADSLEGTSLSRLSNLLLFAWGRLSRRLAYNHNDRATVWERAQNIRWGRGSASGGGAYSAALYWVAGPDSGLAAGIYHYSPAHHALRLLEAGDATGYVSDIQGYETRASSYVLVTVKYWQNAHKYADFAYQATAMDIGTILGTWDYLLQGESESARPDFWVDELRLATLLGIDPRDEGVYAVIPWGAEVPAAAESWDRPPVRVRSADTENSPRIAHFETTTAMQRAMRAFPARPSSEVFLGVDHPAERDPETSGVRPGRVRESGAAPDVIHALHRRESSYGRFNGGAISLDALLAILLEGASGPDVLGATVRSSDTRSLVRLYVYALNVDGLEPGVYLFTAASGSLSLLTAGDHGSFLNDACFLNNYDITQCAAAVVAVANVDRMCTVAGVRGYRMTSAMVSACAQKMALEAAGSRVQSGLVLGFDPWRHKVMLGLSDEEDYPMLMVLIGQDTPKSGRWASRIHRGEPIAL
jgi:SagB-type dehydrogenase family enzyme